MPFQTIHTGCHRTVGFHPRAPREQNQSLSPKGLLKAVHFKLIESMELVSVREVQQTQYEHFH